MLMAFLAACSDGSVALTSGHAPSPQGNPGTATRRSAAAHVGQGFTVTAESGGKYDVYFTRMVDPAHGSNAFTTPDKGNRFVGAVFTIKGISGSPSDDANNDAILIGSNGQTYTADFDSIKDYTNFNDGQFNVSSGAVQVGAVTFQVPDGIEVTEIQWSSTGGFGGTPAVWRVTR
jgi:hypothetical protein